MPRGKGKGDRKPEDNAAVEERVELQSGEDGELMGIAQAIVDAQSREIEAMNSWREDRYGSASPAGGVPAGEEGAMPSHMMMDHG